MNSVVIEYNLEVNLSYPYLNICSYHILVHPRLQDNPIFHHITCYMVNSMTWDNETSRHIQGYL